MYKLLPNDPATGESVLLVQRLLDGAFIPFVSENTDYQEYLKWVAEGNTPEPADQGE